MQLKSNVKMTAIAACVIGASLSASRAYEADGIGYDVSCNADGYVLTSKQPVTRMVATPVDAEPVLGIEKIYFGKSCDAFHKLYGKGKWCWANGGFVAEFANHRFGFGRQELTCPAAQAYQGNCGCE
jgi:hypothetical protein